MNHSNDISTAIALLKRTLPEMNKRNIPTTPNNYAIWYEYVNGDNQALENAIQELDNKRSTFTNEVLQSLYSEYISDAHEAAVNQLSQSVKEIIHDFEKAFNEEKVRIEKNWSPLYHYKSKGFYFEQLDRYYNLFSKENIHIVLFEEIIKSPEYVSKKIFNFLSVDNSFIPDFSKKINVSGTPKGIFGWIVMKSRYFNLIPNIEFSKYLPQSIIKFLFNSAYSKPKKITNEMVKKLTDLHYKEDILKLEKLINKDLKHWLS